MKVGFVGLGDIGAPMAQHVARAHELFVWARNGERARSFAGANDAVAVSTFAELIGSVDALITCLPTSDDVAALLAPVDDEWRPGQLVVDATSGDPFVSLTIAERLGEHSVGFVDAPVSGGTDGARNGNLTVMLGGEQEWIEKAQAIVAPYSAIIEHVGAVGAGHAVKAVNNALLAVHIQAAGEGLAALTKFGVDPAVALGVINASSGQSFVSERIFPERVITRAWPRTFRLALLDKDIGVALRVLDETGVPSAAIRTAREAFAAARAALGEEADHAELVKEIERAAGVEIR